jgi:hypothetical protein
MELVAPDSLPDRSRCVDCGAPIEGGAGPENRYCAPCDAEWQRYLAVMRQRDEQAREDDRRRRALRAELGMPPDAIPASMTIHGHSHGAEWDGYDVEMYGIRIGCDQWPPPWPFFRLGPMVTQVWYRRVTAPDSPAYLEARWHPERGESIQLKGLELVTRQSDAERALRGLRLLRLVDKRGRKPGSRTWSKERFVPALLAAYHACADRSAYETGDYAATERAVALELGISHRSFCRYLEKYQILWPPQ